MYLDIQVDGASHGNPGPAAIGAVIKDRQGTVLVTISQAIGEATNNQAEYRALIEALKKAVELGVTSGTIRLDSELAMRQLSGQYRVKSPSVRPLYVEAAALLKKARFKLVHVGHEGNHEAHALAQAALHGTRVKQ
ncbi:MAG: ribonuclease HI family protein [Chloroflexota bacterium]